jgi:hypothetical protein
MMVLLRYLYGLPYIQYTDDEFDEFCLQSRAQVYVVAKKYQISRLRSEAYTNMEHILGPLETKSYGFVNFPAALKTIFTVTTPESEARVLIMQACIAGLHILREDDGFVSLLLELPDLGVEIIKHLDLQCKPRRKWSCKGCRGESRGVPSCAYCVSIGGETPRPFEEFYSMKQRSQTEWTCPNCLTVAPPCCSSRCFPMSWKVDE